MGVEVLIRRKIIKSKAAQIAPLMVELRSLARGQAGYISSESLKCIDPPIEDEYLIRSTWESIQDWQRWRNSDARQAIQKKIDEIAGVETEYRIYEPLVGGIHSKFAG
jgi:heme-degrading monooxygenase HmoA